MIECARGVHETDQALPFSALIQGRARRGTLSVVRDGDRLLALLLRVVLPRLEHLGREPSADEGEIGVVLDFHLPKP